MAGVNPAMYKFCRDACAPHLRTLDWFALPSVSGLRLVPSDRPRASGTRDRASPEIRVSLVRRRCSRSYGGYTGSRRQNFRTSHALENKKPSGALAREGPCETDFRYRLGEIAPMSRARAIDRPKAVQ